jgi:hypothetical protein
MLGCSNIVDIKFFMMISAQTGMLIT